MEFAQSLNSLMDLTPRLLRRLSGKSVDYRKLLFDDLKARLGGRTPRRILEIGPKDGEDTRRLASLGAEKIVLIDLPNQQSRIEGWLPTLGEVSIELIVGNFMYDSSFNSIEPFDLVWCTGVLYHNPEQLRFIRQLFDVTSPDGLLVIETATARRSATRNDNCVEIWFPPNKSLSRKKHLSVNVTHLPSARAVESWMEMIGFSEIQRSDCHRRVTRRLAADRVAFIATRKVGIDTGTYYGIGQNEFPIGRTR
jgi:SAM-dependent methyltransferase